MRKIIFLDIDGVLATPACIDESGTWTFTNSCQDNLEFLLKETGAEIVISSSWRMHSLEATVTHFKDKGFRFCDKITGITIRAYHYIEKGIHLSIPRGVEIKQWLDYNLHSKGGHDFHRLKPGTDFSYVILDDDSDFLLEQGPYFVRCNPTDGLDLSAMNKAISILNCSPHQ